MAESPGDGATCYMSDRTSAPTRIVTSSGTGTEGTRCGRPQRNTRDDVPGSDDVTTLRPQDASVVPVSRSRRRVPSKRPRPDRAHVAPFFCRAVPSASDHPEIPGGTPQTRLPLGKAEFPAQLTHRRRRQRMLLGTEESAKKPPRIRRRAHEMRGLGQRRQLFRADQGHVFTTGPANEHRLPG